MRNIRIFLSAGICCGVIAAAGSCGKDAPSDPFAPDYIYEYDDTDFINPERGMYQTNVYYFRDGEIPSAASVEHMRSFRERNMSLSFSQFYLMDFLEDELSPEVLATIRDDFRNHRAAGLKTIVRFCYNYTGTESDSPKEPEVDLVLRHIEQVKPLLQEYSDIIYVLQAGFIGSWGEWSISTHFGKDSDRRRVVDALLDALPPTRQIQLRTPAFKRRVFGSKLRDTITLATAFDGSPLSRVGGHNDCFLANGSDAGTYSSDADRILWEYDTRYTIMGGETCIPDPKYCNCTGGIESLETYHWSYLNRAHRGALFRGQGPGGRRTGSGPRLCRKAQGSFRVKKQDQLRRSVGIRKGREVRSRTGGRFPRCIWDSHRPGRGVGHSLVPERPPECHPYLVADASAIVLLPRNQGMPIPRAVCPHFRQPPLLLPRSAD